MKRYHLLAAHRYWPGKALHHLHSPIMRLIGIGLLTLIVLSSSSLFTATAFARSATALARWIPLAAHALVITIDADGPDDEPSQSDVSQMGFDTSHLSDADPHYVVFWSFDDTAMTGGNSGDGCALFDGDGDGFADFAMCLSFEGDPVIDTVVGLYDCKDNENAGDQGARCPFNGGGGDGSSGIIAQSVFGDDDPANGIDFVEAMVSTQDGSSYDSFCTLNYPTADPFNGVGGHTASSGEQDTVNDTGVTCTIYTDELAYLGPSKTTRADDIHPTTLTLTNVCSYTSLDPSSDPKDCIVPAGSGFLQIVKNTTGGDETFDFTVNGQPFATITTSGGTGESIKEPLTEGNYTLAETNIPSGWGLVSANCVSDQGNPAQDPTTGPVTLNAGETLTCTYVNEIIFVPAPAISLTKSGVLNDGGNGANPGDTINYTFVVQNVGNIDLNSITISDPKIGTVTCPQSTLATDPDGAAPFNGESMSCTGSYTITQTDINAGQVDNTATVSGSDGSTTVQDTDNESVTIPRTPQITIDKEGALNLGGDNQATPGDLINYTFAVANLGNVTLQNVTVSDPLLTNINCGGGNNLIGTLAPGGTALCTGTYAITQNDINAGQVDNTAQVTGNAPGGGSVTDEDTNTETIPQNPALSLVKVGSLDAGSDGIATPGDLVNYTLTVINTGNVTLNDVTVSDPLLSNIDCANTNSNIIGTMQPGATVQCTGTYTITQADIDTGKVDNTANVTGTDPNDQPVNDSDENTVVIPQTPLLSITKDGALTVGVDNEATPGDIINYTFVVENTGNVTLQNVTVSDPLLTNINCGSGTGIIGTMAPGASVQCTGSYAITQTDIDASKVDNTADVDGSAPGGAAVHDEDSHTEDIPQMPAITIVKSGALDAGSDGATPGDLINYTFAVENIGNVTLNNVTVVDPLLGLNCTIGTLTPGASDTTTCVGSYIIIQIDIDSGQVDNSATVTADPPTGTPIEDTDNHSEPIPQQPSLSIDKEGVVNLGADNTATVGDVINYTFVVVNTGNVTLSDVTVSDGKLGVSCNIGTLAPGASDSTTCTGSYIITQQDIDSGQVDNLATVQGTPPNNGTPVNAQDPNTEGLASAASIALEKDGTLDLGSDGVATPGDIIHYTFTVENTGNVTLDTILVTDTKLGLSCTISDPLLPGEIDSTTCTGSYVLTQQDIDNGSVTNQADVSAQTPSNSEVTDSADNDEPIPQDPALSLQKSGLLDLGSDGIANVGDVIHYTFVVTNSGNVTLNDVTVTDPKLNLNCTIVGPLAPSASNSSSCTGSYTLTQADVDAGNVQNTAIATATPPSGSPVITDDTEDVPVPQDPQITIDKVGTLNQGSDGIATPGDTITYLFIVENSGNVTLDDVVVTDTKLNLNCYIGTMLPGAVDNTTCTASYTITQNDIDAGIVQNTATATGTDPNDNPTTDSDLEPVTIPAAPGIVIEKEGTLNLGSDGLASPGDIINYTFVVRNTGNVSLDNIVVTDAKLNLTCTIPGTLAPGASDSTTCTASHVLTQTDIDARTVVNTAFVSGDTPDDTPVNDEDENTESITVAPSITINKEGLLDLGGNGIANPGDVIHYSFVVENTGNVTLDNVVVTDTKLGLTCNIGTLAPGATHTSCTGSYTITQTDIDAGFVDNLATVSGTPRGDTTPVTDDAPNRESIPQTATINIVKTGTLALGADNQATPGDLITYQFSVQNTGNVTLHGVVVTDPLLGLNCTIGTLTPGAIDNTSCEADYPLLQSDIDTGQVDNTATVSALTPANTPITDSDDFTVPLGQTAQLVIDKQLHEVRNPDNSIDPLDWVDQAGDVIVYDIVVTNTGNVTLHQVVVNDNRTNTVNATCGSGTLLPGQSCTVTVQYTVLQSEINNNGGGDHDIDNTATADSAETAMVSDSLAVPIAQADIGLTKIVDNATPVVGAVIQFTIQITNSGPAVATGVAVEDIVPAGFANITNVSNGGTVNGNVITWSGLTIPVNGQIDLTFDVTVMPPTGGADGHINMAQVTAGNQGDPDSVPDNNNPDEDDQDSVGVTVRGSIYLAKIAIGDDGSFGFDTSRDSDSAADITIITNNGNGEEQQALSNILPGPYTITELVPAGWAATETYCLDRNSEIYRTTTPIADLILQPGQIIQCYFVNIKLGTIAIEKVSLGGAQRFDFDSNLDGGTIGGNADFGVTTVTPGVAVAQSFVDLMPGTYTVTELVPNDWSLTDLRCTGDGDGDTITTLATGTAEIHLDAGESISCRYENTKHGSITIAKELSDAVGLDRAFDFSSSTLGNNSFSLTTVNGSVSTTFDGLLPGNYDANEIVPTGWQLTDIACVGAVNSTVTESATGVAITLAAGEELTCTFTNDPLPTATVEKSAATTTILEPGGTVQFTVVVRNTSPTEALRLTALVDNPGNQNLALVCPLPSTPLAPAGQTGDRFTCTFTRNVTGAPGDYPDTVTATLSDDDGNTLTPEDSATVTITDVAPTASVQKEASPSSLPEPGGPVTFAVTVNNLSDAESLTLTSLIDAPFGNITTVHGDITRTTCQVPQVIAIGGSYSCEFTVDLQGQPGNYADTVTATLADNDGNIIRPTGTATVTITDVASSMNVIKTALPAAVPEAGGNVTFTVEVENTSPVDTITLTEITDDIYGQVCGAPLAIVLAPGARYTCEFVRFISGETGDIHTNQVTVTAVDDDGAELVDDDTADVLISDTPATLHVHKQANVSEVAEPGGDVTFTVVVENNSSVDRITLESVTDDRFGNISSSCTPALPVELDLGESVTCVVTERISGNAGDLHINVVTATGTDDDGFPVSDSDQEEVRIDNVPSSIKVLKLSDPTSVPEPGGDVTFTIFITNTSAVDTVIIENVVDDQFGNLNNRCAVGNGVTLTPGEVLRCEFSEYVTGPTGGQHTNIVTATGIDDEENPVEDFDVEHVDILDLPSALLVTKVADRNTVPESGETVTFTVNVRNASLVDSITVNEVVDDIFGDVSAGCTPTLPTLIAPSESIECLFSEFIDGAVGSTHRNVVTASGIDDDESDVSGEDDAEIAIVDVPSSINVIKTASPTQVAEPGGDVTFLVTIENTSPVDAVTLESVEDDQFGDLRDSCDANDWPVTLAVGETLECTFTEYIAGAPGDTHRNVVTVSGTDDDELPVSGSDDEVVGITDLIPVLSVSKVAQPTLIPESGALVTFTVEVVNTSAVEAVTLTDLVDSLFGDLDGVGSCRVPQVLSANGGLYRCAFSRVVSGDVGTDHVNVVVGTAYDDEENEVSDEDDAQVVFSDVLPTIEVIKQASTETAWNKGEVVTFTVEVINTGLETVTLTSLTDTVFGDLNGLGTCSTPQVIGVGATYRCRFAETISGEAGADHVNVIEATASDNEGNTATDQDDATVSFIAIEPLLDTFKSATLLTDTYSDEKDKGKITPGDTLRYHLTVLNRGNGLAEGVVLTDTPDAETMLVVGSVTTTKGTIRKGNNPGDTTIEIQIGTLEPNEQETVEITFDVIIDPETKTTVLSNQAAVLRESDTPGGTAESPSDDPSTPQEDDPTVTRVIQIPTALPGEEEPGVPTNRTIFVPVIFR